MKQENAVPKSKLDANAAPTMSGTNNQILPSFNRKRNLFYADEFMLRLIPGKHTYQRHSTWRAECRHEKKVGIRSLMVARKNRLS